MGCPKSFSISGGMGAALLSKPELIHDVINILNCLFLFESCSLLGMISSGCFLLLADFNDPKEELGHIGNM